jgi:hypothetical protein
MPASLYCLKALCNWTTSWVFKPTPAPPSMSRHESQLDCQLCIWHIRKEDHCIQERVAIVAAIKNSCEGAEGAVHDSVVTRMPAVLPH